MGSDGEQGAANEASLPPPPAAHLLLCGSVPNRPQTGTSLRPRGWGPLFYRVGSLVVQWLRLRASTAGGTGLIRGRETKIPRAARCGQKKKKKVVYSTGWGRRMTPKVILQSSGLPLSPQVQGQGCFYPSFKGWGHRQGFNMPGCH